MVYALEQQNSDQGCPDLNAQDVFAGTDERLDLEALFKSLLTFGKNVGSRIPQKISNGLWSGTGECHMGPCGMYNFKNDTIPAGPARPGAIRI
jgi:hypothetical protein